MRSLIERSVADGSRWTSEAPCGREREQVFEELRRVAGRRLGGWCELETLRIDQRLVPLVFQSIVDLRLGDPAFLDEDLPEEPPRALLLAERLEELRRLELLVADEDLTEPIQAALQHGDFVFERARSGGPETALVVVVGGAEAVEAKRAELRRMLRVTADQTASTASKSSGSSSSERSRSRRSCPDCCFLE
jgi:hypothetical protein